MKISALEKSFSDQAGEWKVEFGEYIEKNILRGEDFLLGFHLRHVFDPGAPRIELFTRRSGRENNTEALDKTKEKNKALGLETLNHVLDSLFHARSDTNIDEDHASREEYAPDIVLCVRAKFDLAEDKSRHYFALEDPGKNDKFWDTKTSPPDQESVALQNVFEEGFQTRMIRVGIQDLHEIPEWNDLRSAIDGASNDNDIISVMFGAGSWFYSNFVYGAEKLCHELGIEPSIVAYRSILAALYQLHTYTTSEIGHGKEVIVMMARSGHPYGHAIGFTLITRESISVDDLTECMKKLKELFERKAPDAYCNELKRNTPEIPPYLSKLKILDNDVDNNFIVTSLTVFLDACLYFCDEKLEGRQLRFGLVLGSAGLMSYWPGSAPLKLNNPQVEKIGSSSKHPHALANLPKLTHLIEPPGSQGLFFPYFFRNEIKDCSEIEGLKVLEYGDFEESFAAWREGQLWPYEHRPYAYMTKRYPWCIAAVVGPHSEMRIFKGGNVLLFRDGKGWKRQIGYEEIEQKYLENEWLPERQENGNVSEILKTLLCLSVQMSEYGCQEGSGGFLVYVPVPDDCKDFWKEFNDRIRPLSDYDPQLENAPEVCWLKKQSLLRKKNGRYEKDVAIAQRVLRAASLDGAVVFSGPEAKIQYFACQLDFPHEGNAEMSSGTKRGSAINFVNWMRQKEKDYPDLNLKASFAITISSDGPIRLYLSRKKSPDKNRKGEDPENPILIFEDIPNDT